MSRNLFGLAALLTDNSSTTIPSNCLLMLEYVQLNMPILKALNDLLLFWELTLSLPLTIPKMPNWEDVRSLKRSSSVKSE